MTGLPWQAEPLTRLLARRERMPHALLVSGREGIGKAEFARAFAKSLLCESPVEGLACGRCAACGWFAQGNHPDYREVVPEAAEEGDEDAPAEGGKEAGKKSLVIKIDQVRALADLVSLSTHRAGWRVVVIRPAEALQPAAANALLKTLEEPPPSTAIVLVSDRPARLLPTIRSRCQSVPLRPPPAGEAVAWLAERGVKDPELALALAGGAPLLAAALAEPEERDWRGRVVAELSRPDGAHAIAFATGFDRARLDRTLSWMQSWVHDLVRLKTAGEVRHHRDARPALAAKAKRARLDSLLALERELVQARRLAAHPLNARLVVEHLMLAYNRATLG